MLDVFSHFTPKRYFDRLSDWIPNHAAVTAFPRLPELTDLDARLRLLDEFGGLQQVLSLSNPPIEDLGPPGISRMAAIMANDELAGVCCRHPNRFPAFVASLPMNDIEASLEEIDRSITKLGARGIQLFTNVIGKPLSDPEFRPIFRMMAAYDLPVWIHPIRGPLFSDYATEQKSENEIWFTFGWPYETTACMTRLIFSGIFDELPTLKIISHHFGGMIPFYAGKIKLGFSQIFFGSRDVNPLAEKAGLRKKPVEYFKMLYADTALNGEAGATRCGFEFFGSEHSLFATDAPFDSAGGRHLIRDTIGAVDSLKLSRDQRDRVFFGNTKSLLKL